MKNILIVEDEFIIAILIEKQINKLGYNVIAKATNGQKTIDIVKENNCDLVLMDIKILGDLDGVQTMQEIRTFSDIPVIYITGNSDPTTREKAMETNPAGYIIKPIEIDVLKKAIEGVFN